ncbi:MAG: hypothetical protein EG823_07710 [Actinobacteria bacterium]|nr:hypothetical protein [Actinomycetota bacterium]
MTRTIRIFAVALALTLLLPASALAGPVREYQLQYAPVGDANGALMIVSALVDPQIQLPAIITVPVPAGATLLWAGEILGGDPAADPIAETTVETVGDMDVYTLTLEQSYTAQLEIQLPAAEVSGDTVTSTVVWTNPGDDVMVNASIVAEAGATDAAFTPAVAGEPQTNSAGETLYPLAGRSVASGEEFEITTEWKRGAAAPAASESGSPLLPALLGGLVAAVLALVAVLVRERTRARRSASGM